MQADVYISVNLTIMKKILLLLILAGCMSQLQAQTLPRSVWGNKQYWSPFLKAKPDSILFKTNPLQPGLIQLPKNSNDQFRVTSVLAQAMNYNMPIAKVSSNDRMPIVKTDEPGMHYTMLIKGYVANKQDTLKIAP